MREYVVISQFPYLCNGDVSLRTSHRQSNGSNDGTDSWTRSDTVASPRWPVCPTGWRVELRLATSRDSVSARVEMRGWPEDCSSSHKSHPFSCVLGWICAPRVLTRTKNTQMSDNGYHGHHTHTHKETTNRSVHHTKQLQNNDDSTLWTYALQCTVHLIGLQLAPCHQFDAHPQLVLNHQLIL